MNSICNIENELIVVIRVFENCSLGCHFCGYSRELQRSRRTASIDPLLKLSQLLGQHEKMSDRHIHVSWLGGEPLEWNMLPRLAQIFHDVDGLSLGITTNGLPLGSKRIRTELIQRYDQVTISIDGLEEFHDTARGKPGLFEQIRRNIGLLQQDDLENRLLLRVNTILMQGNIAHFPTFCKTMADWGIQEITFNPLGGRDRPEFFPKNKVLPEQIARFRQDFPGLCKEMAQRRLHIKGTERYLHRLACSAMGVAIPVENCDPGQRFLFVDEQCRISPCSFTCEGYGIPIEKLSQSEDLRKLPEWFSAQRQMGLLPSCHDCHATHVFDKFGTSAPFVILK